MSRGAFIRRELVALWRSVVDSNFARRFIEAGEGLGFEAYTQGMAQLERVSQALDTSFGALYILPHSSQTSPPAGNAAKATVNLVLTRTQRIDFPITFIAGQVIFAEETTDHGDNGPVIVRTGRRYTVQETVTIGPGDAGPFNIPAIAMRSGYSSNNAQPGNIKRFEQPAAGFQNDLATVGTTNGLLGLVAAPDPDVPSSTHVGAYLLFVDGSNQGQIRRVTAYAGPDADSSDPNGGILLLAATGVWQISALVGTFQANEVVTTPTGEGVLRYQDGGIVVIDRSVGAITSTQTITGAQSGATLQLDFMEQDPQLVAEADTATWKILDWEIDFGLVVTNPLMPTGGKVDMLGMLGRERKVYQIEGESEDAYRKRIVTPADVVSPNAIIRAGNRALADIGKTVVLREVGLELFRGMFYDGNPASANPDYAFAYDLDFDERPQDRLKVALSFEEMRAFFLLGVPKLQEGDFGIFYDVGDFNAYDAAPYNTFADGYPYVTAARYRQLWHSVNEIRAGGVGFDLYLED